MTRRRPPGKPKKRKRGVLSSLRGGFKSAVRGATGAGLESEVKKEPSRFSKIFWNVITGILIVIVAAVWARRCGIVRW